VEQIALRKSALPGTKRFFMRLAGQRRRSRLR
jgi:hypothetical protein